MSMKESGFSFSKRNSFTIFLQYLSLISYIWKNIVQTQTSTIGMYPIVLHPNSANYATMNCMEFRRFPAIKIRRAIFQYWSRLYRYFAEQAVHAHVWCPFLFLNTAQYTGKIYHLKSTNLMHGPAVRVGLESSSPR